MPAVYDKVCIRNEVYNYEAPREKLRANLESYFPAEKAGIAKYFEAVDSLAREAKSYFMEKALPPLLGRLASPFLSKGFCAWSDKTTYETVKECTSDPKLIGILTAQYGAGLERQGRLLRNLYAAFHPAFRQLSPRGNLWPRSYPGALSREMASPAHAGRGTLCHRQGCRDGRHRRGHDGRGFDGVGGFAEECLKGNSVARTLFSSRGKS